MARPRAKFAAGKGKRLSNIKRANIGTNKRLKERKSQIKSSIATKVKAGGFSRNEKQNSKPKKAMFAFAAAQKAGYFQNKRINYQQRTPEEDEEEDEEVKGHEEEEESVIDEDMEEEDLEYIKSMAGSSGFLANLEESTNDPTKSRKAKKHEKENKLASFEERPRLTPSHTGQQSASNMKALLPIKHAGGLEYRWIQQEEEKEEEAEDPEQKTELDEDKIEPALQAISTIQLFAQRQEKIVQKKQRIAMLASSVVEDPEKNVNRLKDLRAMLDVQEPDIVVTTRKLVMLSLVEVFKDVTPGYRVREWGEKAKTTQLSKEAKLRRDFEEGLLKNYKFFLEFLERTITEVHKTKKQLKKDSEKEAARAKPRLVLPEAAKLSLAEVATRCLCTLLNALPHFNYRTNIISVVASRMTSRHEKISTECCQTMKKLFKGDSTGEASLDAVRYISRIARNHGYQISPEVLKTFLSLRIKEVKTGNTAEENRKKMLEERKEKFKRLSRSQKRYHKRLEKLNKELQATEAQENKNKKLKLHTEIVQIVFATYFRILKRASHSVMLPSVLEGLAKFAHLINVEFFDDLIHVLHNLVEKGDLKYRESLHCTLTAFHILSGQGEVLNIDPSKFYAHLYITLPLVHAGVSSEDAGLVCECLEVMISKRRKQVTVQRVLGFLKRLATLALLGLPNAAIAYLATLRNLMKWYPKTDVLLDNESMGSGMFSPELGDPEHCHAQNTALWELPVLQTHYHPMVRQYASYLAKGCPSSGTAVPRTELVRMAPMEIVKSYNPSGMKFNPPLPPKQPTISKKAMKARARQGRISEELFLQEEMTTLVSQCEGQVPENVDFSSAWCNSLQDAEERKGLCLVESRGKKRKMEVKGNRASFRRRKGRSEQLSSGS
ncbi:nucleolar complex protein 3 homolog [Diadema antillarum]|uniref:nucleolar complex protein 3 homolog n=1 Tax=Diadema antillarum TaxID=105358 RepID=UPI003A86A2DC